LITKIESGRIDPSYSKTKNIFEALQQIEDKNELKAKDLMQTKIVFSKSSDKVKEIIKLMRKKGISQIPILEKEKIVGIITEGTILKSVSEHPENFSDLQIKEIMEDVPPIISEKMGIKTLLELLSYYSIILVGKRGDIKGIITKSDLLDKI